VSDTTPSPNGPTNGRDAGGRFAVGNPGGPGNPRAAEASARRAAFWAAVRSADVKLAVMTIRKILKSKTSKDADKLAAAREILDRVIGKPAQADLLERIERLEQRVEQKNGN
jgi:hypothetical protein